VKYFTFDLKKRQTEFKPGIMIDLKPFPGTLAVGIDPNDPSPHKGGVKDPMAPVSTIRPWKNGSNMDLNEMQEGSTIFIPIFLKGAGRETARSILRRQSAPSARSSCS
jgi:acetamidase/formamidase